MAPEEQIRTEIQKAVSYVSVISPTFAMEFGYSIDGRYNDPRAYITIMSIGLLSRKVSYKRKRDLWYSFRADENKIDLKPVICPQTSRLGMSLRHTIGLHRVRTNMETARTSRN